MLTDEGISLGLTHAKDGYRSGLESGEEGALQEGFEAGFRQSYETAFEWGRLRAAIVYVHRNWRVLICCLIHCAGLPSLIIHHPTLRLTSALNLWTCTNAYVQFHLMIFQLFEMRVCYCTC